MEGEVGEGRVGGSKEGEEVRNKMEEREVGEGGSKEGRKEEIR